LIARFYGYKLDYIKSLDYDDFNMLVESMGIIQAREKLNFFDVVSYPNASGSRRKKAHKDLSKKAYPARFEKNNAVSLDEAFAMFTRM
jgi:hypothetical protein